MTGDGEFDVLMLRMSKALDETEALMLQLGDKLQVVCALAVDVRAWRHETTKPDFDYRTGQPIK